MATPTAWTHYLGNQLYTEKANGIKDMEPIHTAIWHLNKALSDFTPYQGRESGGQEETAASAATPGAVKGINEQNNNTNSLYQSGQDPQTTLKDNLVSQYLEDFFIKDIDKFKRYKDRKTGFSNLDELTGGLYPGLYVIGGAISSLGKTTFIHQMGDQLAEMGDHVLFFQSGSKTGLKWLLRA